MNILLVDDESLQRETLADILCTRHHTVDQAASIEAAKQKILQSQFDLIISDFKMPGGTGLDLVAFAREAAPSTATIIMTAFAEVEVVIEALRLGVTDFLTKPINVEALCHKLEQLQQVKDLMRENSLMRRELNRKKPPSHILIGKSKAMGTVREHIHQFAPTGGTVLISGESGTGKELIARQIHTHSDRCKKSFVAINCGAIPENLLESELFGHKKGSFTGASADHEGLFVAANRGTLFLDEIGELSRPLQVKLLRAIQEKEVTPIGSSRPIKVDIRLIAATNRNLEAEVQAGNFRQDLYYRLNVLEIFVPSLRNRIEDIPELCAFFAEKYCRELKREPVVFSSSAIRALCHYHWTGNVRELQNIIERTLILHRGQSTIEVGHLPQGFQQIGAEAPEVQALDDAVKEFSRQYIIKTLEHFSGDKREAAKALKMGLSSLYRKMDELSLRAHSEESISSHD